MGNTQNNDVLYHYKGNIDILVNEENCDKRKEKIKLFLSNQFQNRKLNIFIGSGCSTPAVPLMGETIKDILKADENKNIGEKIDEYIKLQNKGLCKEEQFKKENFGDIEGFLTWLSKGIDFEKDTTIKNKYQEIYNSLRKQFIDTIPTFDDEKYNNSPTKDYYTRFYQYIFDKRKEDFNKLNIFTTNYDLFNEYSLENCKVKYTTGFDTGLNQYFNINQFNYRLVDSRERYKDKWQPTTKEANLYKLHGSINWIEKNNRLLQYNENDENENIIIYPTALKHQETRQSPYSELFRELSIQLQKPSSTLVMIGYGFGDDHINNIISQNLANSDFTLIVFGNVEEDRLKKFKTSNQSSNFHIIGGSIGDGKQAHYLSEIVINFCENQNINGEPYE
ncbi:MAG: SIR2 family protein [Defluviitaleaceae bacterium]|nr:SIR2 family protein [Defluviitaleaceae bacterium]